MQDQSQSGEQQSLDGSAVCAGAAGALEGGLQDEESRNDDDYDDEVTFKSDSVESSELHRQNQQQHQQFQQQAFSLRVIPAPPLPAEAPGAHAVHAAAPLGASRRQACHP